MTKLFEKFENWVVHYTEWVIRWRWVVIFVVLGATVFAASGARFLRFSTSYRVFFSQDNPQLASFEELQKIYTKNDNILFLVVPKNGDAFSREALLATEELTREAWKIPFAIRVDSVNNFQHTESEEDDLIVRDLVEDVERASDSDLAKAKSVAVAEPLILNKLVPPQAHVSGVNVTFQMPEKTLSEVPEAVSYARALAKKIEEHHPKVSLHMTGMVMLNNAFAESGQGDMMKLVPLMYLVMIVLMVFMLRSFWGTVSTVAMIMFSTLFAMGLAGWAHVGLTPPSASAPTMIMTLAIADSIHIWMTLFQKMRAGLQKKRAIVEALRINMQPVFLTSLTTAIGFLSMNFSDVPPIRHLGNITALGVVAAFFYSVVLLPAVMSFLPIHPPKVKTKNGGWIGHFADFVRVRWRFLIVASVVVVVALGAFVPANELDDRFVEYFDHSQKFRRDTDFVMENLSGMYVIEYSLGSGESGGISEPAYLKKVEEFSNWYRAQPGVVHVNTLTDIFKRLNKNMHGDDPDYFRLPQERNLAAQYLLLFEMSLPFGLDLNNQINVAKSATKVTVTLDNITSFQMRSLTERAEDWLRQNAPESMFTHGASPALMFSYISKRNINSMLFGTGLALVFISVILIFALRSLKYGLVSLIPNLVPAIMAFGIWGIWRGQVNMGLSMVMGMTLGIVVDDTVHFLSKFLRARREEGMSSPDAVKYAFSTVGEALVATSVILVGGFLVLAQSSFAMNSDMAKLTAITIALALAVDFVLLPALLICSCTKEDDKLSHKEGVKNEPELLAAK